LACPGARISPKNGHLAYADPPKNGYLAEGAGLSTRYSVASKREATYEKRGNHYQDARRRELGMDTRNQVCKGTEKGDN
jgi:hypothetical protein